MTVIQASSDDDVQVATSEAEQEVCQQLAFLGLQLCGNEVEED